MLKIVKIVDCGCIKEHIRPHAPRAAIYPERI